MPLEVDQSAKVIYKSFIHKWIFNKYTKGFKYSATSGTDDSINTDHIVKNIPVMWKLYRGFKNAPDLNTDDEASTINEENNHTYKSNQDSRTKLKKLMKNR